MGAAYETATRHRRPPASTPALTGLGPAPVVVTRLAGPDRVATALAISADRFVDAGAGTAAAVSAAPIPDAGTTGVLADAPGSGRAGAVVLAAADATADALVAGPLAVALGAPLLLTARDGLDPRVADEVARLLPPRGRVVLVGGEAALGPAVAGALGRYAVERLAGGDRYATAVAVAREGLGAPPDVMLATGRDAPDALAASAAAAALDGAVLLTDGATLPALTAAYLHAHGTGARYAVGGPAATADPTAVPLVGPERTATAAAAATPLFPAARAAGVAGAGAPADALAGAVHVADEPGPLLLTDPQSLSTPARAWLDVARPALEEVTVYGGTAAVTSAAVRSLGLLGRPERSALQGTSNTPLVPAEGSWPLRPTPHP